jgi:dipeptide transport system ATP-binding protein
MPLLEIRNLTVEFPTVRGPFKAVDSVDLTIEEGELVGVVGESGSGKSVTMLALMGLIAFPGRMTADRLAFAGHDLMTLGKRERRRLTGKDLAMIFQEPMTSLNPCYTVGFQIAEALRTHVGGTRTQNRRRAVELLERVGIPAPEGRLGSFPHQLSGGMNQRVMIAMAIACKPRLLLADEPTTALDVTIQAQILDLLVELQREEGMALVLVTHDMGVVAETAERVVVMYAGQVAEQRDVDTLFSRPRHPYTAALLDSLPERSTERSRLPTLPGVVPGAYDRPRGCLFHPRCRFAQRRCVDEEPQLVRDPVAGRGGARRCHFPLGPEGVPE